MGKKTRDFTLRLNTENPREKTVIDILDKYKAQGFDYKDTMMCGVENLNAGRCMPIYTGNITDVENKPEDKPKSEIKRVKPVKNKITPEKLNF